MFTCACGTAKGEGGEGGEGGRGGRGGEKMEEEGEREWEEEGKAKEMR